LLLSGERMNQWKEQLLTVFHNITADDMKLELASLRLSQLQLSMVEDAIRLNGLASGHIMLELR
jgi:hypothetical protein